ncbi:hypothetical protein [Paenarthrobacter sp. NPDC018779]|uniref:hypothetical protein n=1 Tax=Paenarthrobacter sp. NPDC018779 TaxID=3364375 RepID=UPI0037CB5550
MGSAPDTVIIGAGQAGLATTTGSRRPASSISFSSGATPSAARSRTAETGST